MDEFTQRMMDRARERRQNLAAKMAEVSPNAGSLKRRALAERQETVASENTEDSPKRHCASPAKQEGRDDGIKSRLKALAQHQVAVDEGKEDILAPLSTECPTRADPQLPANPQINIEGGSARKGRFAALASQIGEWEDELPLSKPVSGHPPLRSDAENECPKEKSRAPPPPAPAPMSGGPPKPPRIAGGGLRAFDAATASADVVMRNKGSPSKKSCVAIGQPTAGDSTPPPAVADRASMWENKAQSALADGGKLVRPKGMLDSDFKVPPILSGKSPAKPSRAQLSTPNFKQGGDVVMREKKTGPPKPAPVSAGPGHVDLNMSTLEDDDPLNKSLSSRCNVWEMRIQEVDLTHQPDQVPRPKSTLPGSRGNPGRGNTRPASAAPAKPQVCSPQRKVKQAEEPAVSSLSPSSMGGRGVHQLHQQLQRKAAGWHGNDISKKIRDQKAADMEVIEKRWENGPANESSAEPAPKPEVAASEPVPLASVITHSTNEHLEETLTGLQQQKENNSWKPRSPAKKTPSIFAKIQPRQPAPAARQQPSNTVVPPAPEIPAPIPEPVVDTPRSQPAHVVTHAVPESCGFGGGAEEGSGFDAAGPEDEAAARMLALIRGEPMPNEASPVLSALPAHVRGLVPQDSMRSLNSCADTEDSITSLRSDTSSESFAFSEGYTVDDVMSEYGATTNDTYGSLRSSSSYTGSEEGPIAGDTSGEGGGMSDLLDEAMDRLESPPVARKVHFSQASPMVRDITPANSTTCTESESDFEPVPAPRTKLYPSLHQVQEEPAREYEDSAPISISSYRASKQYTSPQATVVVRRPASSYNPDTTLDESLLPPPPPEESNKKIKHLQELVQQEQSIITQASNALNQCRLGSQFAGGQEQVECNRLLLLACQKRQAYLAEVARLKSVGGVEPVKKGGRGSLTISDIRLPLKQEFVNKRGTAQDLSTHYFLCLVRNGPQVISTQMVCTHDPSVKSTLDFCNLIQLSDITSAFRFDLQVYSMSVRKEPAVNVTPKKKKGLGTPKKLFGGKTPTTPYKESPAGPTAVHTTQFTLISALRITLQSLGRSMFNLERVPYLCPLQGSIHMKLKCCMESTVTHKGFLTMFEDVSGFGAWHRRWFVLKGTAVSFWKYPDEEKTREPIGVLELKRCVTREVGLVSRDQCARPNTFELMTVRPLQHGDRNSLISRTHSTQTSIKHWLSADTKEERVEWCRKMNKALSNVRQWNSDALRPEQQL